MLSEECGAESGTSDKEIVSVINSLITSIVGLNNE